MLTIHQDQIPDLEFKEAIKKPIPIKCIQINEPFEVETMEGTMRGKKGDWLMVGIDGEMYACDAAIFKKTYELCE
ncbi:hypothetical protein [Cochleicola gelatinilyticus]|uniref:Uncharacterized protein n=1 Tax=Cochleicola gelatinilyticus TaxID=1763537 RepID=A0A167GWP3_9FLAO|nr:hypothetical protein [Cochleicola gelatinilyticus]OAB77983.1 hypothetical protein ULVI_10870 [Cochleicola gelatinilyticus]